MRAPTPRSLLRLVLCVSGFWGLLYIYRCSFPVDGRLAFCLWDDAMISMRYAQNLARGHGLVWNPGEAIQGFSNLGMTLLMTLVHVLPLDELKLSLVVQLLCLGCLLGVLKLVSDVTATLLDSDWGGAVAAALAALCAPLAIWTLQGSDAGPATLSIL